MDQGKDLAPVSASERIGSLDVLRGFALLGIFLMNIEWLGGRPLVMVQQGLDADLRGLDRAVGWIVYTFIQGKFWTLFAMLFGMGFALMQDRAERAGRSFVELYLRRTVGLLGIGLVHALLLWAGDILFSYAIAAFALLLFFRNTPVHRLWKWGVGLYATLFVLVLAYSLVARMAPTAFAPDTTEPTHQQEQAKLQTEAAAEAQAYAHGSYREATRQRVKYFAGHAMPMSFVFAPLALGMFLIGAWLLRSGAIVQPAQHLRLFRRLAFVGLPIGWGMAVLSAAIHPSFDWSGDPHGSETAMTLMMLAGLPISLGYASVIVLLMQQPRWAARLAWLAPAGRMALTNYLLQSAIGTMVFYGYGWGLWGQVSRAWQVMGVLVVFAMQVYVSRWWLLHFRYGPIEWLWRGVTYLKLPPLRRAT